MRWFSNDASPTAALVVDGVTWGVGVGVLGPLVVGAVGSLVQASPGDLAVGALVAMVGAVVGTLTGAAVGVIAGLVIEVWRRLAAPPAVAAIGTVLPVLIGPVLVAVPADTAVLQLVVAVVGIAALPVTIDVVRLVRRTTWPRRPGSSERGCVVLP